MPTMTILGDQVVDVRCPGSVLGGNSYRLDGVQLRDLHHDCVWMLAQRMRAESEVADYQPTYDHVVKFALQHAAAVAARGENRYVDD